MVRIAAECRVRVASFEFLHRLKKKAIHSPPEPRRPGSISPP
jgi:hypothetical protein